VLGPHGGERAEAARGLDVADDADGDHGRGLDDGGGLDDLLLVHLCERASERSGSGRQVSEGRLDEEGDALEPGRSRSRTTWVMPAL